MTAPVVAPTVFGRYRGSLLLPSDAKKLELPQVTSALEPFF